MNIQNYMSNRRIKKAIIFSAIILVAILVATIFLPVIATNNKYIPPTHLKVCVNDKLVDTVEGYAKETHHGQAHVDRWKKVLAAFGDDNGYTPMTSTEAQQMYDKYNKSRWRPVREAIQCLEKTEQVVLDELYADIQGYAKETHHGQAHVDRWKKVLAAFGDDNGYTPMTSTEAQQYKKWSRWLPVIPALEILEARQIEDEVQAAPQEIEVQEPLPQPLASPQNTSGTGVHANPHIFWQSSDFSVDEGQNSIPEATIEIRVTGVDSSSIVNGENALHTVTGFEFSTASLSDYTLNGDGYYIVPKSAITVGGYAIADTTPNFFLWYKNGQTSFSSSAWESTTDYNNNTVYRIQFELRLQTDDDLVTGDRTLNLTITPGTYDDAGTSTNFSSTKTALAITVNEDDQVVISAQKQPYQRYTFYNYEYCYSANSHSLPTTFKDGSACDTGRFWKIAPVNITTSKKGRVYPNNPDVNVTLGYTWVSIPCVSPSWNFNMANNTPMNVATIIGGYYGDNLGGAPHYDPKGNRGQSLNTSKDDLVCLNIHYKAVKAASTLPKRLKINTSRSIDGGYKLKFSITGPTQDANKVFFSDRTTVSYSHTITQSAAYITAGDFYPYARNNDNTVNTTRLGSAGDYTCAEQVSVTITIVDSNTLQPHPLASHFNVPKPINLCS